MSELFSLAEYDGILREVLASDGEFRLYPHGTSMLPLLRQGKDSVVLKKPDRPLKPGDIVLYQRADGSYILHRLHSIDDGSLTFRGDNQLKLERGIPADRVIGLVTCIYRGDTPVNPGALGYRLYLALWRIDPFRFAVLKLLHLLQRLRRR